MLSSHARRPLPESRYVLLGISLMCGCMLLLAACADSDPDRMAVTQSQRQPQLASELQSGICIRNVTGGEDTTGLTSSAFGQVKTSAFQEALTITLRNVNALGTGAQCRYYLDANILGLSRPAIVGSNPEVVSSINYKLYDRGNGPVLLETVTSSYTGSMSEALIGATRLERASEGSVRANISEFLQRLSRLQKL
jgi:hypothetical protein